MRARVEHVAAWLREHEPDVLLMQELKGTDFPAEIFPGLGFENAVVSQKTYNGVAILSRHPIETIRQALVGDETDSHARYLEVIIRDIRVINIYLPNGNPVGSDKFAYKLAWMDRLIKHMSTLLNEGVPALIGGDFNVLPEDIDCH
ncbi:MAG: exodeoxyribonuclease III, partial [Acidobacteriota bacterium]|nr:exodeoxyribonuclease III [Acidobacteriota bacterium]